MNDFRVGVLCGVLVLLAACKREHGNPLAGQSVGEVITNVVMAAQAGETAVFAPVFQPSSDGNVAQLLGMIQESGMLTNYSSRLQMESGFKARLDYHYLERGCHFQADLEKEGSVWRVTRIWFCR